MQCQPCDANEKKLEKDVENSGKVQPFCNLEVFRSLSEVTGSTVTPFCSNVSLEASVALKVRNKTRISTRFFVKEAKISTHFGFAMFLPVIPRCFETTVSCESVEIGRLQNEYSPPGL